MPANVWRTLALSCLLALPAGCSAIRVERGPGPSLTAALRANVPGDVALSPRTLQELYRLDLYRLYPDSMDDLAARLHAEAVADSNLDCLFALSEIEHVLGRKREKEADARAASHYFRGAGYAWHYLFGARGVANSPEAAFDPRFRLACDLYNTALARCLVLSASSGQLDARGKWDLPGVPASLKVEHVGFLWKAEEFGPMTPCSANRITGLGAAQRTYGLGVPFTGRRAEGAPARPFVHDDLTFAVTALCRFDGTVADLVARPAARLEFVNPLAVDAAKVGGRAVPLEADLTTPMAHYLGTAHLESAGYLSFLKPNILGDRAGLHFLEPYAPGKIPLVLVHGLLSSPQTWAPVVNDLLGDPLICRHFRIGIYFYPTGEPYLATAADLRRDLAAYRKACDPAGKDAALMRTVVAGHSMGGLIARLLTVEGGDDFWAVASDEPLDRLRTSEQTREELRTLYYFGREPGVTRAIFMGTPHGGSDMSPSIPGRLAARVAGLPRHLMRRATELERLNPSWRAACKATSVEMLAPDAPTLRVLASRLRPEGVAYHSLVGVLLTDEHSPEPCFGGKLAGDGVVPYQSAHLEGASSELIVQADHTHLHHHPLALRELRRILHEHVKAEK